MDLNNFRKIENEAGYPCYIDDADRQYDDHPQFSKIMESLEEYNGIKYSAYRIAFKVFALQKQLQVPALRISSGVFARHQLSLSESSLSLDTGELEAVLADIYFAAQKEGVFTGDVELAVDLMINLLLNVYDRERKEPIRVLAAKTLLIILSEESVSAKWAALAHCCADHNGCVSTRRLAALLTHLTALPAFFGDPCDQIQSDVDSCFEKSAGMLGVSARGVAEWGVTCASARWLSAAQRVRASRNAAAVGACAACREPFVQVLKFKCAKCIDMYFCEKCYLYDKDLTTVSGHKNTHVVHEIVDGEIKPPECLSFIRTMRRFFFCTKTKKKKTSNKRSAVKRGTEKEKEIPAKRKEGRPKMVTSTVGKASGNAMNNPETMLQDIINQLETQNKALEELSVQLQNVKDPEEGLRVKVDSHWSQISKQINRLKILKETLATLPSNAANTEQQPEPFDHFSPIPLVQQTDKRAKAPQNLQTQPRVLSLDSGNFSVTFKHADAQNLVTVWEDGFKPVVVKNDTISTVSMKDISSWYNEDHPDKTALPNQTDCSISATEQKYAADIRSVQTSNDKVKELNADLDTVLDRLQQILTNNFAMDDLATEQKYAADIRSVETNNDKMKELNADLDTVLDRLQQILTNNFAMDESSFDNNQLRETANEMEGLLGTLIRGVEQRATLTANKGLV